MWIVIHMGVVPVHYRCTTFPHGSATVALPLHYRWYTLVLPSDHRRRAVEISAVVGC